MAFATRDRLGPYVIEDLLGAGGMGEVYRAIDTRLHRTVAVKVLPEHVAGNASRRERLAREARAVAGLSHPHIRALYDVGEQDGVQFLVMEHLDGETLAQRLTRGALPFADVARHAIAIADALDHAHRQGVIHRDLKPANVMLTRSGAKLLDFGLARLQTAEATFVTAEETAATEIDSLTEDGATVGTIQYMSPEQLEGRRVDHRTDVFAFGAVIYEMVTGQRAFVGRSKASLIAAILEHDPPPISDAFGTGTGSGVPTPLLNRIVSRCLAKNPDERWQSASDLKEALTLMAEHTSGLEGATAPRAHRQPSSHVVWLSAGILSIVVLLAVTLVVTSVRNRTSNIAGPMRWILPAPDGTAFDPASQFLAVSPDGTHVAFIASSGSGQNALWVRALDALTPRRLVNGAQQPFWSPDSRFIAFFGDGTLKKVELATGLVQPLANIFLTSGSWSRDGTLLVSIHPGERRYGPRQLYRISASGGSVTAATTLDTTRGETAHSLPSFLPDGRHFLFSAGKRSTDNVLFVGSLDSPDRIELFPEEHSRAVYASGCLLFARGQTLLAQPFNTKKLQLEGEPSVVAEDVERSSSPSRVASFSVSQTGILAYRPVSQNELVWFERSGRSLGAIGEPGIYTSPALSPDDHRIAVSRHDPVAGQSDIWVIDVKTHVPSKFTFGQDSERMPLWSPDGSRLVYKSGSSLVAKASTGAGAEEPLVDNLGYGGYPLGWSPDGQMIVYSVLDSETSTSAWMSPIAGARKSMPLLNTGPDYTQAQISPNGRWLAYVSRESGTYNVYLRPYPSGDGQWMISPSGGIEPSWRRDGKELFYLAPDGWLMAVPFDATSGFTQPVPIRLFETKMSTAVNTAFARNQYVASADGQHFLVNQPTGKPAPIVVVVDWPAHLKRR